MLNVLSLQIFGVQFEFEELAPADIDPGIFAKTGLVSASNNSTHKFNLIF